MTETIPDFFVCLIHVPDTNMEKVGYNSYTATSHRGMMEMIWLHFKGSLTLYSEKWENNL